MADTIDLSLKLSIEQLKQQLAQLGPTGDKEAAKLVNNLTKQYKKAEAAAKASSKASQQAFSSSFNKVSAAGAALTSQVGGPIAQIGAIANSVVRPLSEAAGGLGEIGLAGAAVAGAGIALGGIADVAVKLADHADSAAKSLHDMGIGVGDDARADLAAYAKGQGELSVALDKLEVSLGKGLAKDLGAVDDELARGIGIIDRYALRSGDVNDNLSLAEDVLNKFAHRLGYTHTAIDQASESTHLYNMAQTGMVDIMQDQIATQPAVDAAFSQAAKSQDAVNQTTHDGVLAKGELTQATKEWALEDMLATLAGVQAADKRIQAIHDEEQARDLMFASANRQWDDFARAALQSQHEAEDAIGKAGKDFSKTWGSATEDVTRMVQQVAQEIVDQVSGVENALDQLAGDLSSFEQQRVDAFLETGKAAKDAAKKAADAWSDSAKKQIEALHDAGRISDEEYQTRLAQIGAETVTRSHANDAIAKANLKAARDAFKLSQDAQLTQAIMAGALAEIQAFAQLGPVGGPIAAAIIGADTGIQIGLIEGQKPPSYPTGGMVDPDHHLVGVQSREAVLSRRATTELGADTIAALNRGQGMGAQTVVVQLGRRVLAEALVQAGVAAPRVRVGKRRYRRR